MFSTSSHYSDMTKRGETLRIKANGSKRCQSIPNVPVMCGRKPLLYGKVTNEHETMQTSQLGGRCPYFRFWLHSSKQRRLNRRAFRFLVLIKSISNKTRDVKYDFIIHKLYNTGTFGKPYAKLKFIKLA